MQPKQFLFPLCLVFPHVFGGPRRLDRSQRKSHLRGHGLPGEVFQDEVTRIFRHVTVFSISEDRTVARDQSNIDPLGLYLDLIGSADAEIRATAGKHPRVSKHLDRKSQQRPEEEP